MKNEIIIFDNEFPTDYIDLSIKYRELILKYNSLVREFNDILDNQYSKDADDQTREDIRRLGCNPFDNH